MNRLRRIFLASSVVLLLGASLVPAEAAPPPATTGAAPGGPGSAAPYLGSNKAGFGTAYDRRSTVWYTLQLGGGTGELYFPNLGTPVARSLGFVVVNHVGEAVRVADSASHHTSLAAAHSLTYRQTDTDPHHGWRLVSTYVTDPRRSTVLVDVRFTSLNHQRHRL